MRWIGQEDTDALDDDGPFRHALVMAAVPEGCGDQEGFERVVNKGVVAEVQQRVDVVLDVPVVLAEEAVAEVVEGLAAGSGPWASAIQEVVFELQQAVRAVAGRQGAPISPADWQLFYDGDTVSLTPSIGNWGFPCHSHYWIKAGQIRWSHAWTDGQMVAGRARDDRGRAQYFAAHAATTDQPSQPDQADARTPGSGFWLRLRSLVTTLLSRLRPGKRHGEDRQRAWGLGTVI
jgi:hypothetical protein